MQTLMPRERRERMSSVAAGIALCLGAVGFAISFIVLSKIGLDHGYIQLFQRPGDRTHEWEQVTLGSSILVAILVSVLVFPAVKKLFLKPHER
jgi:hypothetical protein